MIVTKSLQIHGDTAALLRILNLNTRNVFKLSHIRRFKGFYDTAGAISLRNEKFIINQYVMPLLALSTYRWMMALYCAPHPIITTGDA